MKQVLFRADKPPWVFIAAAVESGIVSLVGTAANPA